MIWKTIEERPKYQINEEGQVQNKKTGRILKQSVRKDGYCQVQMGRKTVPLYIHRMVAVAFIPNPLNMPQVDHINGDKQDNRIENLRWATATSNYFGSGYEERIVNKWKPILATNSVTGETMEFESRDATAEHFDCNKSNIKYNYVYTRGNKKDWSFQLVEDIV